MAVSRASEDVRIYTNDAVTLGARLATDVSKTAAVDFRPPSGVEKLRQAVEAVARNGSGKGREMLSSRDVSASTQTRITGWQRPRWSTLPNRSGPSLSLGQTGTARANIAHPNRTVEDWHSRAGGPLHANSGRASGIVPESSGQLPAWECHPLPCRQ